MLVFLWCGCNCNQNIPNFFEERKAQMEHWSVQLKWNVFVERFVILEHGMVNSEGYLLFFLFFNTQWWFLFLQKKGILCLCAQLPIAEQLPFIPICCMPFPPGKKNLRMIVARHSLKSTHIFKQRNKQKIDPANTNLCSIPMSLISCRKLHVRSVSYLAIHKRLKSETM